MLPRRQARGLRAAELAVREESLLVDAAKLLVRHGSFVADGRTVSQIFPDADVHFHADQRVALQRSRWRSANTRSPAWFRPRRGAGRAERSEFVQWRLHGEATLQAPLSTRARAGRIRNKTPEMQTGIDAVLADARHSLSMRVKLLEQRREGREFLVAARMTLADISVGYPLNNMVKPHFAPLLGPRATAYRERLLARPAFQRAAAVP